MVGFALIAVAHAAEETPYVPTPQPVVDAMLNVAKVRRGDYLIDLGSGDGRIVITAAKQFGVTGFGVDLDPRLVKRAQDGARSAGVADRAKFYARDLYQTDLKPATVITMYLLPDVNLELRERMLGLKPGTRIVTHDYDFGDWRPEEHLNMPSPGKTVGVSQTSDIFFFIVPAKVAGAWQGRVGAGNSAVQIELRATQKYQDVVLTGEISGAGGSLRSPVVQGERMTFSFDQAGATYLADLRVSGDRMSGVARRTSGAVQAVLPIFLSRISAPR